MSVETAPERALTIAWGDARSTDALLVDPPRSDALLVLAHGAGAGMRHPFMRALADSLAVERVATLRYEFPYLQAGSKRPDPPRLLEACVRAAVAHAATLAGDRPLFAGGKSMGGRMTSQAQAAGPLAGVRALVFFGFPLHPAKAPSVARAAHLAAVTLPMLFLQGSRDALADPARLRPVCAGLGERATHHEIVGADHGFAVSKRSGRTDASVIVELAAVAAAFLRRT